MAEDTRRTGVLLRHHGIAPKRLLSYHKFNEAERLPRVVEALRQGQVAALVTDAGTPGLSDPGEMAVRHVVAEGLQVFALPGPQSILPALTLSGLPTAPFTFIGFLPRRGSDRKRVLEDLKDRPDTLVLFETANRLAKTLSDLADGWGDREACVAREITKLHETVLRGPLSHLRAAMSQEPVRGEIVLVVRGASRLGPELPLAEWVARMLAEGVTLSQVKAAAAQAGFSRNEAFKEALRQRE